MGHYRSFVGTTRCLADLRAQLAAATGHLDALASDLPKLQAACDAFRQDAAAIATRRADNRQLYSAFAAALPCGPGRLRSVGILPAAAAILQALPFGRPTPPSS